MPRFECQPLGDTGIRVQLGDKISPEVSRRVRKFVLALQRTPIAGVIEWVPAYTTVSVYYRPDIVLYHELKSTLQRLAAEDFPAEVKSSVIYQIPTCYGDSYGPDLAFVAEYTGLSPEEVIGLHSSVDYLVYMIGFAPGFPYLGGLNPALYVPRLAQPRAKVGPGSVGIGGEQTGIYPIAIPGGWQIIGRTPIKLYDPLRDTPGLLSAGDYVRFIPVAATEYMEIEALIQTGQYAIETHRK